MVNYIVTHSFLFKEYFSFKRPQISVKGLQWIKTEHKLKRNVFFVFFTKPFYLSMIDGATTQRERKQENYYIWAYLSFI